MEYQSFRARAREGLWRIQDDLKALADSSKTMRHFLPAIPSGLLQTEDYARAVLNRMVPSQPATNVDKTVRARIERQRTMHDGDRRFFFVLTEQAVRWRCAGPSVLAEQCRHMAAVARRSNIDVAVIPQGAEVSTVPLHVFVVYDERLVTVELLSGTISIREPQDIRFYLDMFEKFRDSALLGDDAVDFLGSAAEDFMRMVD